MPRPLGYLRSPLRFVLRYVLRFVLRLERRSHDERNPPQIRPFCCLEQSPTTWGKKENLSRPGRENAIPCDPGRTHAPSFLLSNLSSLRSRIKKRDPRSEGRGRKRSGSSAASQTRQVAMRLHWSADGACTGRPVRTTSLSWNGLFEDHTLRYSLNDSSPSSTPHVQPRRRTPVRWSR